jgi:hypothetical protein
VAFLRFSRDKRGVESFSLVHATANRRGKVRPRILYWFRTPPDIKVGREPFDADVRRALEKQNPDILFDWRAIQETPIPSADADKWRERRRAERAAKHAARAEEEAPESADGEAETENAASVATEAIAAGVATAPDAPPDSAPVVTATPTPTSESVPRAGDATRKRRRRRRSGGSRGTSAPATAASGPPPSSSEPSGD